MKKTTVKLSLISVLLFFCFLNGHAQRDFRPGFVINNRHDTIHGYLLYKASSTSETCVFKKELAEKPVIYSPSDILAFRFSDGKYYVSREVTVETGKKLLFLEFLLKGKASIYYMRDGTDHYFIEKDGRIIELTEKEKIITTDWGQNYVKPDMYPGKLKSVLSDCPEIFPEIDRSNLNHSSLIRLARDYHARVCSTEECIVFQRRNVPVHVRVGLYGGFTMNRIQFGGRLTTVQYSGGVAKYGNQLVSGFSPGATAGCRVEVENIFSSFEHASLLVDVALQQFSSYHLTETGEYDMVTYNGHVYSLSRVSDYSHQTSLDVNVKTLALKIPLQFGCTFLKGGVRPYVTAGVMNMFILSQNKDLIVHRFADKFGKSIPTYHVGFTGSAGAKFMIRDNHYFFVDMGYEYTITTNVWADWRFINNQFGLKAGFAF